MQILYLLNFLYKRSKVAGGLIVKTMLMNLRAGNKTNLISGIKFCVKAVIPLNDLYRASPSIWFFVFLSDSFEIYLICLSIFSKFLKLLLHTYYMIDNFKLPVFWIESAVWEA